MSLPNTYWLLDYIQSSRTQFIDTGVLSSTTNKIFVDFKMLVLAGDEVGMGVYNGTVENEIIYNFSNRKLLINNGTNVYYSAYDTERSTLEVNFSDKTYRYNDGVQVSFGGTSASCDLSYYIFARNRGVGADCNSRIVLYACKIWDNNVLQRDFVPAMRVSDSVVGLYDLVNDVFYENQGTGTFTYGRIITDIENITLEDNPLSFELQDNVSLQANFKKKPNRKVLIGV